MAIPRTSSTSSSSPPGKRLGRAAALALGLLAAANLWVGARLPWLAAESSVGDVGLLDERVAAFPARERVKVLVFGNSHAMFALRPPALAPALGLEPDEAFCLALGGGTALEARLLARRHRQAFPNARVALVMADESLMGRGRNQDARRRWLTRFDPAGRWRVAGYGDRLDARVTTMAWLAFPVADFNAQLRKAWAADRGRFLRRLAGADVAADPRSMRAKYATLAYRWGHPIGEFDPPEVVRRKYLRARTPTSLRALAKVLLEDADLLGRSFDDLEGLCAELEAAGLRVMLVGGTLPAPMRAAIARVRPAEAAAYQAELRAYLARSGRPFVALPDLPLAAYGDANHVDEAGARAIGAWVAERAPGLRAALR